MPQSNPFKILVVDDTEATQYALARVLIKDGFEVLTASTGRDALTKVEEFSPDLVTLDIHLPDISGFEVCRRIKGNPETAHTAVLQISASYVSATDRIYGLDGGADGYLTHPVEGPVLIATIRSLLRLRAVGKSLRESEERFRLAVENTQLGTWEYCVKNQTLQWSDQCKQIFGFSIDTEITYEKYLERLHPDEKQMMLDKIDQLITGQSRELSSEHRVILPDGTTRWIQGRGALHYRVRDGRKTLDRIVGTVLDITDRKNVLSDLQVAKEAAESANRAKSQFIANVSHEIRTPLGAILGFADLVTEGDDLSEEKKDFMRIIQRNALQLSHLIDEILDLSKVEADKMVIENIPFNFADMISDIASVFKMKAQEKGLNLTFTVDSAIPKLVTGDPTRWRQILLNLLNNAVKFTDQGFVSLIVRLAKTSSPQSQIFNIDIVDTGIGLQEDQAKNLFQPFVQADSSMTRRFGGTGLGLSLSRRLAHAMDGELELVTSTPGKGSTFRLTLPAGPLLTLGHDSLPSKAITPLDSAESRRRLEGLKVLIVEDAKDNQIILERILSRAGASVVLADQGREGVEKAQQGAYNVVLMDIQMPGMDGYQAVAELRSNQYSTPIIALTAHALKGERERCLDAGFSDYMTKPIDRELLLSKVQHFGSLTTVS